MPPDAVYVGRPTDWGNHWRIGEPDPDDGHPMIGDEVIARFKEDATKMSIVNPKWLEPLRDKDLACWCPLTSPCHADILLNLANPELPMIGQHSTDKRVSI